MRSTRYSCQILIKLEFSLKVFEKYYNTNLMKIRPVGTEFRADGQNDETDSRSSQFWERA
jgi:hypothetical protein